VRCRTASAHGCRALLLLPLLLLLLLPLLLLLLQPLLCLYLRPPLFLLISTNHNHGQSSPQQKKESFLVSFPSITRLWC
jgi:hypothetical protein